MTYTKDWKKQIVSTPYGDHIRIIGTYDNRQVVVCDNIQNFPDAEIILFAPKMHEAISDLKKKFEQAIKLIGCDCEQLAIMGNKPPCYKCEQKKILMG